MRKLVCFVLFVFAFCTISGVADAKSKNTKKSKPVDLETKKIEQPAQTKYKLTIAGGAIASKEQAVNFIKKYNPNARLNCSVEEIVDLYYREAALEGIRPDIALSQALLETGFFRYGGDVKPYQNNFCGLGSVGGGAKGATFKTPEIGVRAHIQHLLVYSSKELPKTKVVDPRYEMVRKRSDIYGACVTWYDLDGRWAAKGVPYGERILNIHERLLGTEPKNIALEKEPQEKAEANKEKNKEKVERKKDKKKMMKEKVQEILAKKEQQGL